eukprot:768646-Hanusia_phi.AAC.2
MKLEMRTLEHHRRHQRNMYDIDRGRVHTPLLGVWSRGVWTRPSNRPGGGGDEEVPAKGMRMMMMGTKIASMKGLRMMMMMMTFKAVTGDVTCPAGERCSTSKVRPLTGCEKARCLICMEAAPLVRMVPAEMIWHSQEKHLIAEQAPSPLQDLPSALRALLA